MEKGKGIQKVSKMLMFMHKDIVENEMFYSFGSANKQTYLVSIIMYLINILKSMEIVILYFILSIFSIWNYRNHPKNWSHHTLGLDSLSP